MANIFRGPLYVARREVAPVLQLGALAVTSLLATTLATSPLPVGAQSFPLQVEVKAGLNPNPDTSHGTPKTLIADAQLPFAVLQQTAPDRVRPVVDASQETPLALLTVVLPAPFVPVLHSAPARSLWMPADESSGSAKPLIPDKQAPFFVAPQFGPVAKPYLPFDTTLELSSVLRAVVVAPFVPGPHYPPPRLMWLPADESSGTAKGLIPDKQLPFSNLQQTPPDAIRPVWDTSQSAYATTKPVVVIALPVGASTLLSPLQYPGQIGDTSSHLQPADVVPPVTTPTWGTFPNWKRHEYPAWWPHRKKKLEDDFKEEVREILEAADLPAKPEQVIRELSAELARDKIEVEQLRRAVQARLSEQHLRNTQAAKAAVEKIATAKREAEAKAVEYEQMEVERKNVRRKKVMHILKMLH